jgi:heat shock protein HtpX
MDEAELRAILAHEAWHLRQNAKTPILRHISMITFTRNCSENELESLADRFAAKVVSKNAVESARAKLS